MVLPAAVLVTSEEFAKRHGLQVRGRIVSRAVAGVDPERIPAERSRVADSDRGHAAEAEQAAGPRDGREPLRYVQILALGPCGALRGVRPGDLEARGLERADGLLTA